MSEITRYSYSKVNLFLKVREKLPTGKHSLDTLICLMKFGDLLTFKSAHRIAISGMDLPLEENLVFQAATLLNSYTKQNNGIEITIHKNVPEKAGLGGGSGDAGLTLSMLNELWDLHLEPEHLVSMARELGSDVEFFLKGQHSLALGSEVRAIRLPKIYFILVIPKNLGCSTREIFAHQQKFSSLNSLISTEEMLHQDNDLQDTALGLYQELKEVAQLSRLTTEADIPYKMTGSGSTFFCGFYEKAKALTCYQALAKHTSPQKISLLFTSSL